jgi:hypothetical protein
MGKFMFFICVSGLIVIGMLQAQATHWWQFIWLALTTAVFTIKLGFMMRDSDKNKHEGKNWKAIFIDDDGELRPTWETILTLTFIVIGIGIATAVILLTIAYLTGTPLERYTEQYEACIATEHFTDEQCHEIGIEAMTIE